MSQYVGQSKRSALRRSKEGCLTCRRNCFAFKDEKNATKNGHCVKDVFKLEPNVLGPNLHALESVPPLDSTSVFTTTSSLEAHPLFADSMPQLQANGPLLRHSSSNVGDLAGSTTVLNSCWSNSRSTGPPGYLSWMSSTASEISTIPSIRFCVAPAPYMTKNMAVRMSEYAHDFGPRIIWPPEGCTSCDELDPEGAAPVFRQAMMAMTQKASAHMGFPEPGIDSTFLTRLFYDYALTSDKLVNWILRRFNASNSSRYAMTAMAALYRSDYQRSIMTSSWRVDAKELYSLAFKQLPYDLEDVKLSPWEKLLGLIGVMDFEVSTYGSNTAITHGSQYHTGQLSKYYSHGTLATPLIKEIVGSDIIDLFKLQGDQMFDVSMWVWCDILDSMATSKPTRLKYESDLENVPSYGSEEDSTCQDRGLEWLYGIPNAFAVLLARTSAIRDAKLPEQEKMSKGSEIEQLVRNWQINPLGTKTSRLRVARVGAQEIWRHTVILYVHHVSVPSLLMQINGLRGFDRFIAVLHSTVLFSSLTYYGQAGFYAVSQKDRYAMKSRLIGCGNALYLRNLARNLDELWHETDSAGHLTSWSQKKPPRIALILQLRLYLTVYEYETAPYTHAIERITHYVSKLGRIYPYNGNLHSDVQRAPAGVLYGL
ncbi:hypothetical protein AG1IA_04844 [Rhizoctonia solani AG-1 IA]|uniref:Fungal zn(2)-Cys(6) binuclear cluster domain-containing protein n=1 Tax=Thanatephorus cucumeris (strain AG1-IA) TaxID=983506 RepID=L8WSL1_THACA|nr:hypothetical protein AG1IA_04844 [Rhizoctonia solani AG-1 IA]